MINWRRSKQFTIAFLLLGLLGCKEKELTVAELELYILDRDNGLYKTQVIDDLNISIFYKPNDLVSLTEVKQADDSLEVQKIKTKYNDYSYYVLQLSAKDGEVIGRTGPVYSRLLQALTFDINSYVSLFTSDGIQIPLSDSFFNNTFNTGISNNVLLVFGNRDIGKNVSWVEIQISELGLGVGTTKFKFYLNDINNTPPLKV